MERIKCFKLDPEDGSVIEWEEERRKHEHPLAGTHPYRIILGNAEDWTHTTGKQIDEWCEENNISTSNYVGFVDQDFNLMFEFEHESDAMAFKLRWL